MSPVDPVSGEILAAGAVLWRRSVAGAVELLSQSPGSPAPETSGGADEGSRLTIAIVHRPRYDDWSLPKGKLERGESMAAAAVREIAEETGVAARLGPWLRDVRYTVEDGPKLVRYWAAEACSPPDFVPNDEVDALAWVSPDDAMTRLSYAHDADVVARFVELGAPTAVLLLVRHAKAGNRADWDGDDDLRPLTRSGAAQAAALAGLLPHYGPDRIAAAPLVRCRATVEPLAAALGVEIAEEPLLSEVRHADDPDATVRRLRELARVPGVTVVSSQGGVIPDAVAALVRDAAVAVEVDPDDVASKKGSTWVLTLRDGVLVAADYVARPGR